jgi:mannitol/fructose-specific phosphotransferase system IIA component (Ntr-type)
MAELADSVVALGLTRQGVSDEPRETPIEMVFLIVSPSSAPDEQIRILAQASRASQDRHLRERLRVSATPDDVMKAVSEWRSEE